VSSSLRRAGDNNAHAPLFDLGARTRGSALWRSLLPGGAAEPATWDQAAVAPVVPDKNGVTLT